MTKEYKNYKYFNKQSENCYQMSKKNVLRYIYVHILWESLHIPSTFLQVLPISMHIRADNILRLHCQASHQ